MIETKNNVKQNLIRIWQKDHKFPEAVNLGRYEDVMSTIAYHIKEKENTGNSINLLEAGCGRGWAVDLTKINCRLTGIDIDKNALDRRKDLDEAILGDLKSASLKENYFDVIFSYNVLEHIDGAERVLSNFIKWLKPGGVMILRFPNRDSVRGFLTNITPFWFHVFYKKYFAKYKNAGKPGFDPYPTVFDKVVSRKGIYNFCQTKKLDLKAEYRIDPEKFIEKNQRIGLLIHMFLKILSYVSFKKLSVDYYGLLYVIEKPDE
jgi:SAM-dependent methyltransferase